MKYIQYIMIMMNLIIINLDNKSNDGIVSNNTINY